jgi:hypothetical protein
MEILAVILVIAAIALVVIAWRAGNVMLEADPRGEAEPLSINSPVDPFSRKAVRLTALRDKLARQEARTDIPEAVVQETRDSIAFWEAQ